MLLDILELLFVEKADAAPGLAALLVPPRSQRGASLTVLNISLTAGGQTMRMAHTSTVEFILLLKLCDAVTPSVTCVRPPAGCTPPAER